MAVAKGTIVASRYQLVARLGTGAMGEVWRARDQRFESRVVAVKFLRDDETLEEDALSRDRLATRIDQHIARGELTLPRVLDAFVGVLNAGPNVAALQTKITERLGTTGPYQLPAITALFDELASDPDFNENARMRAKLRRFFKDEANSVATLRHDNIVSIFDYGEHDRNPYLVMDFIDGRTLFQVIEDQEPLSRTRRLRLMEDLCAGLGYAHRRKLVHRDIKPANLIIDNATSRMKILDFGVVRRIGAEATLGVAVGTFSYMSPEQTTGAANVDHRSDIFSVGLVFYELLTGRKAFPPGRNIADVLRQIQQEAPPPLRELVPDLQPEIEGIVNRAMEKAPERRYQDLATMEREIARVRTRLEITEHSDRSVLADAETIILRSARPQPTVREPLPGVAAGSAASVPPPAASVPITPAPAPAPVVEAAPVVTPIETVVQSDQTVVQQDQAAAPRATAAGVTSPPSTAERKVPEPEAPVAAPPPPPPPPPPVPLTPAVAPPLPVPPPPAENLAAAPAPAPAAAATPQQVTAPGQVSATPAFKPGLGLPLTLNKKIVPLVAAAALLLLVAALALWAIRTFRTTDNGAPQQATVVPQAPPVSNASPEAPPPPPPQTPVVDVPAVTMTEVTIDLRPWARVRIVPPSPDVQVPGEPAYTPFTLDLPPGEYTLECENGGVTRATKLALTVGAGPRQSFTRNMPGFNATKTTDALLGQED